MTKPSKVFTTSQNVPKPPKASQNLAKPAEPSKASQRLPITPKAFPSLAKPQGARANGRSTEKHETFVTRVHFLSRKHDILINGLQQIL